MNSKFDQLAKTLAQTTTRRQALKRFGVGLAGLALACFGLANGAKAATKTCLPAFSTCTNNGQCCSKHCFHPNRYHTGYCQ